ncbi:MAG: SMC-Scp complex subunit ScpB [Lachnospiraceae bacterium]|nr:SMC-Scp complex subunit ScpB [Lachnospiraceae bacterium]
MNTEAAIEGILFAMGQPVDRRALAAALEVPEEEVREAAARLEETYAHEERGIQLITLEDSYQLCTKRECYEPLIRLAARPKKPVLTNVLLETLAIIAYKQPVTKLEIAKIRGVSSDHAVNKLIEYDLVRETGRLEAPGRPILLGTTEEFLRRFCLSSAEDLPELTAEKLAELEEEAERESAEAPEQVDVTV